jgi:hypothetical protein
MDRGIREHLQDRVPAAAQPEQRERVHAGEQNAVLVVEGEQALRTERAVEVGQVEADRFGVPLVPVGRRAAEARNQQDLRAEHRRETSGDREVAR